MEKEQLKKKSVISALSLFFQSGYSAVLGFVANVLLTIYVSPEVFGIYIAVLSIIALLNYFSDIGLAASLIQREDLSDDDVSTAFSIQQTMIVCVVALGFILTEPIMNFYGLASEGQTLYWALLIGFFVSSLKTIPSVFLERAVQFHKVVVVQIIENTVFYISVIILAMQGYGLLSFAYSVILRSFVGLIAIYTISPWMPKVRVKSASVKHLLSYGVPFQSMSFLALLKDELVNLFLGKLIGFEALGYIGWAKKWAESSLRIIMDNISRVVFPLFARIQSDPDKQKSVIERILRYQSMVMIPASLGMMLAMPLVIDILPQYDKWRPALPIFYIFVMSSLLSSYSTPFINFFNGIGKVKISLVFMVMWTGLTWVLIIPLTKAYGMFGFPLTVLALSCSCVLVMLKARSIVPFDLGGNVTRYIVSGIIMSGAIFVTRESLSSLGIVGLVLMIIAGIGVYYGMLRFVFKEDVLNEAKDILVPLVRKG